MSSSLALRMVGTAMTSEESVAFSWGSSGRPGADRSLSGGAAPSAVISLVDDSDGYARSVSGIYIEAVRSGVGVGPSLVRTVQTERLVVNESSIHFPMYSRGVVGDDSVVVVSVVDAPSGTRWCGIDLKPGAVLVYGPGSDHTGVNPVGVSFTFASVALEDVAAICEDRQRRMVPPARGQVHAVVATPETRTVARQLGEYVDVAAEAVVPERKRDQALLEAIALVLSDDRRSERIGAVKRIDPRHVVSDCIDYARGVGRIPSITEMCLVAHISERALRLAFNEVYETSPAAFFRAWALNEAHLRLKSAGSDEHVSRVALDLGFGHLGRFAARYRQVHGESPSRTLQAARPLV